MLQRWNRVYNLSSVRNPAAMVPRHLLDSLAVRPWLPPGRLLDLGSGAGLPGIAIALAEPQRPVTVLDGNAKKTRFLEQVRLTLALDNVRVVHERAECWQAPAPFAVVTARAYAHAAVFWGHAQRYLAPGGRALALKGRHPAGELAGLAEQGVSCRIEPLAVPGLDADRHLVVLSRAALRHSDRR